MKTPSHNDLRRREAVAWLFGAAPGFAHRVAPVYAALNWTWHREPQPSVPTEHQIREALERHIQSMRNGDAVAISCGGLRLWIDVESEDELAGIEMGIRDVYYP